MIHHHRRLLRFFFSALIILCSSIVLPGCSSFVARFIAKSFEDLPSTPEPVSLKNAHPIFQHVGLSVLWVGHATCLIQIGEKIFITDPIFTETAGMISKRRIEPGILPAFLDKLDYILISHIHFDHLSYGSLSMLPRSAAMMLPAGSGAYIPEFGFSAYREMNPWMSFEADGVRITAVPAKHFNGRYGFDGLWSRTNTFTGYVIESNGKTVYFAGDTGYDPDLFREIGRKFAIDLALIPIAPIEPHDFMKYVHTDPEEALRIFHDVRAKFMIPIHHRTFVQGLDSALITAQTQLTMLVVQQHLEHRVLVLNIGEQQILAP